MTSPRVIAETCMPRYIVTVWQDRHARDNGGFALRAASGGFSANGQTITIADGATDLEFPGLLKNDLEIVETLDLAATSIRVDLYWDILPTRTPVMYDLSQAWGEISEVDENFAGTAIQQSWSGRNRKIEGRIAPDYRWGDGNQSLEITILQPELVDDGTVIAPESVLTSNRFPDIANTGSRDRANAVNGLYPVTPICSPYAGASLLQPIQVVADEDDAVVGVSNLVPREYLVCPGTLANTSTRDIRLVDPMREDRTITGTGYTATPATGIDGLGDTYTKISGDFKEPFTGLGITAIGWTAALPTVSGRGLLQLSVDDQVREPTDGDDDWLKIQSVDNDTQMTLTANYAHTHAGSTGQVIRLPKAQADCAYIVHTGYGGIPGPRGYGALYNPAEYIADLFTRRSNFNLRVNYGDLRNLEQRLKGWQVTTILNSSFAGVSPWDYTREHVLAWLPVIPYRIGNELRFLYEGPLSEHEILTTIDLDEEGVGAYMADNAGWYEPSHPLTGTGVINAVALSYNRDHFKQRYFSTLTNRGRVDRIYTLSLMPNGRAHRSENFYQTITGRRLSRTYPIESDCIGDLCTAGLACGAILYRHCELRLRATITTTPAWRWLQRGDVVGLERAGVLPTGRAWRILTKAQGTGGECRFVLEQQPSGAQSFTESPVWDGTYWDGSVWL